MTLQLVGPPISVASESASNARSRCWEADSDLVAGQGASQSRYQLLRVFYRRRRPQVISTTTSSKTSTQIIPNHRNDSSRRPSLIAPVSWSTRLRQILLWETIKSIAKLHYISKRRGKRIDTATCATREQFYDIPVCRIHQHCRCCDSHDSGDRGNRWKLGLPTVQEDPHAA